MAFHRESGPDVIPVSSRPVECPNCSNVVPAANVNVSSLLAKCDLCGHVIQLADLNSPSEDLVEERPSGIIEETDPGSELTLSFRWFDPGMIALLVFCIFWDGGVIVAGVTGFTMWREHWEAICLFLAFSIVGSVWTYSVLAGVLNKTVISVARGQIIVWHGPLWFPGNRCLPTSDVLEIELDRPRVYLNSDSTEFDDDLTVSAHHETGRKITLLHSQPARRAEYIAHRLASHLQLPLRRNYKERQLQRDRPLNVQEALGRLREKAAQSGGTERNDDIASTSA